LRNPLKTTHKQQTTTIMSPKQQPREQEIERQIVQEIERPIVQIPNVLSIPFVQQATEQIILFALYGYGFQQQNGLALSFANSFNPFENDDDDMSI